MKDDKDITKGIHDKFVLIGIGLAIFYWIFETVVIDVLIFREGTFIERIIPPDPHDLWLRLLVVFLLIMFGFFAQFAINKHRRIEERLFRLNQLYSVLRSVNQTIVRIHTPEELLKEVCHVPVKHGLFQMACIGLVDYDASFINPVACWKDNNECLDKIHACGFKDYKAVEDIINTGNYFICNDIEHAEHPFAWLEDARNYGYRSFASFPLIVEKRVTGIFNLYSIKPHAFGEVEISLLDEMAKDASFALEYVEQERRRRKAEEFSYNVLESMTEGLVVIDRQYRIIIANRAYCEQVKMPHEEIIGRYCYEVSHHRERPCYMDGEECAPKCSFEKAQPCSSLHTHYDKEGKPMYIETKSFPMTDKSGNVVMVIENLNDVTEKKKLQDQLIQAQKMESLGNMAGGIAHDFNNMLTAIMGFGHLLQMDMPKDDPKRVWIDEIFSAGERAANLTQGLLAFSRKQVITPKPVNLNEIIKSMGKMLRRLIREDIEFKTMLAERDLTVMADAGQIEQVLINLVTNARDAMPNGGVLTISTDVVELDSEYMKTHAIEKPGLYALISIADTGVGMDEETKQRIFEPFFTTKEMGKGTGLGLSIVHGIIKQHNGYINVYSELGMGTTFKIYLPLIEAGVEGIGEKIIAPSKGGTETVLLADDEEAVRKVVKTVLENAGYKVIEAVDGMDAVTKFIDNKGRIDILILDVIMPKKNGKDAYEDIKKIKADIDAIFISGYTANLIHEKRVLKEGINFIQKPVSPNELLRKVSEVLDTSKT
jgi:PAS domain S-box-containing protein